jgi:serine/threonine protein kinase
MGIEAKGDDTMNIEQTISIVANRLGNYKIERLIGRGATSRVYLAEHIFLKRPTAIKVLTCDFAEWPDFDLEIFESTAVAAARLNHPNIVTLYDIDEARARPFLLMEYVDGESLHSLIRRKGRLSPSRAIRILREVALALGHAHAAGLVHCDIKPANILIHRTGTAKVTDFGLSQALNRADRSCLDGIVAGTPDYISPEQVLAHRPDERSDLYSLGVTLFEMLTGKVPFRGSSDSVVFGKHLDESRSFIRHILPGHAQPLADIVSRLMARQPGRRYQSARELLADLRPLLNRELPAPRRVPDIHESLARLARLRNLARRPGAPRPCPATGP